MGSASAYFARVFRHHRSQPQGSPSVAAHYTEKAVLGPLTPSRVQRPIKAALPATSALHAASSFPNARGFPFS